MTDELLQNRDGNDHHISATTGEWIDDPFLLDRKGRGRDFTRAEIVAWVADRASALNRQSASVAAEIVAQLLQELRDLETIHTGSFQERLEALGQELAQSDDPVQNLAGKFVEIALLHLRGGM